MAVLRDAIKAIDPAPNKKTELTLALNLISELAAQKADQFERDVREGLRTAGTAENRTIPITEILATHKEYRAYVKDDAGKVATEVADAIRKFVSGGAGDIITGIASLVTTAVEALLGGGTAAQQEVHSYYIVVQDYAIARYDVSAWARMIEAQGITAQIEQAMAFQATKSSVDVTKISFNTFLIAYGQMLGQMGFGSDQVKEYLDYAEQVFKKLRDMASGDRSAVGSSLERQGRGEPPRSVGFRAPGEARFTVLEPVE